jgi:hypothetical protein
VANLTQTYTSGSHVQAWGPVYQTYGAGTWPAEACKAQPDIATNDPRWGATSHAAFDFGLNAHPWQPGRSFSAPWINAWNNISSTGGPGYPGSAVNPVGHNWTKYQTDVTGNGTFVLSLLADNCSWIYLDGTLVGFQPASWNDSNLSYGVSLNGTHTLTFIIFDGGGSAGGMYRLQTTTNPPPPLNPDLDADGYPNTSDAFPLDPTEWADTDGDGHGDNGDAFPSDPSEWVDSDGDGVGDNGDVYPNDPARWLAQSPTTTTVTFGAGPFTYTGSAYAASATVSPGGGTASIVYSGDCTNAGDTCTATATYAGDASHLGSSATASITIAKASSTTTVSFGAGPFTFTGSAFTATAASTAATSLIGGPVIAYTGDCTNGGITCTATATYGGDPNHTGSSATAKITITYAVCAANSRDDDDDDDDDHGDSRGHESGSTLPVKLRVCDAQGRNISSRSLAVKAVSVSPTGSLNDSGKSNPGYLFRLDDGRYQFNLSTKGFTAGNYTLDYTIGNDPTIHHYAFTIRAEKRKEQGEDKNKGKNGKKP